VHIIYGFGAMATTNSACKVRKGELATRKAEATAEVLQVGVLLLAKQLLDGACWQRLRVAQKTCAVPVRAIDDPK